MNRLVTSPGVRRIGSFSARILSATLTLGFALGVSLDAGAQDKKSGNAGQQKPKEITDQSLYSEVIFAELFEKDLAKTCNLLEKLLARRLTNRDLRRDAEYRYHRILMTSGQLKRYAAYLRKMLERKEVKGRDRERLASMERFLRERGPEIQKKIRDYKSRLARAKDKDPEERESIRQEFLRQMERYTSRGRPIASRSDSGSREGDQRFAKRIRRIQELQSRIDKLEKAGKGNSKDAQRLRQEQERVIKEKDQPRRSSRGNMRRWMMSQNLYMARRKIEKSGDGKRLKEFDKLRGEVRTLMKNGKSEKARQILKAAEKRFPELRRKRHG